MGGECGLNLGVDLLVALGRQLFVSADEGVRLVYVLRDCCYFYVFVTSSRLLGDRRSMVGPLIIARRLGGN